MTRIDVSNVQTLLDGPHHVVMKFTGPSELEADEGFFLKVDVSELLPLDSTGRPCTEVVIEKVYYNLSEKMYLSLEWCIEVGNPAVKSYRTALNLSSTSGTLDFSSFGGLPNDAGENKTGDIAFRSVVGTDDDIYTVILYMRKKYA